MELSGSDCDGANTVTSLNFVLSDPVGNDFQIYAIELYVGS